MEQKSLASSSLIYSDTCLCASTSISRSERMYGATGARAMSPDVCPAKSTKTVSFWLHVSKPTSERKMTSPDFGRLSLAKRARMSRHKCSLAGSVSKDMYSIRSLTFNTRVQQMWKPVTKQVDTPERPRRKLRVSWRANHNSISAHIN